MKKLLLLLAVVLISCEAEPTLTGTWDMEINIVAPDTSFSQEARLILQQDGTNLSGTCELFDDLGSYGLTDLLQTSSINGNSVVIEYDANNSTMVLTHIGTVRETFDYMSGSLKVGFQIMGNWEAVKK